MLLGVHSISDLRFLVIWSCLHDAKRFDLLCITLSSWPSLPHALLLFVLYIMWGFLMLSLWRYAAWSSLPHARLLHRNYLMVCCLVSSVSSDATWFCLHDATAWPSLLHATLLHFSWTCPHDATLLDVIYFMLRCFTFPMSYQAASCHSCHSFFQFEIVFMMLRCLIFFTSCRSAWPSLHHVILLYLHQITFFSLILSSWRYTAWFYLLHATVLHPLYLMSNCFTSSTSGHTIWSCLFDATLLDLLYLMLPGPTHVMFFCILTKSCYAAWSGLHDASLLGLHCLILSCLIFPASCRTAWCPLYQVTLLDLVFMMLRCLIFSASCCAAEPPLPVCNAAWCPLHQVMLSHLVFIMLGCLIFSISCQAAGPSLPHVRVLAVPQSMLCYLVLLSRCYIVWFQSPHATPLRHSPYLLLPAVFKIKLLFSDSLIWSSRCYAVWSSLPHATLLDLNSFMLCGFRVNKSCMLLDLGFMTLGCWILFASCYAAWSSLPPVMLLELPSIMFCVCFCLHDRVMLFGLVFMMLRCLASLHNALLPRGCSLSTHNSWNYKFLLAWYQQQDQLPISGFK